jgi:hypothetical protein
MTETKNGLLWVVVDNNLDRSGVIPTTLSFYDGTYWMKFTGLSFQNILEIDEFPDGSMLIMTYDGMYRYAPK